MLYLNFNSESHAFLDYILTEGGSWAYFGDEFLVSFTKKPSRDLQRNTYFKLRSKCLLYTTKLLQEPSKNILSRT